MKVYPRRIPRLTEEFFNVSGLENELKITKVDSCLFLSIEVFCISQNFTDLYNCMTSNYLSYRCDTRNYFFVENCIYLIIVKYSRSRAAAGTFDTCGGR
ncbi:LOW QUALITY PROTEIN: hypothetical protein V1477_016733 [Vespula maculifrons]|uniref:Uncharacterized protein n=1 Tax=Vespula maculifrons TaxID=7453 RepID=A0ABD2B424_VESMC